LYGPESIALWRWPPEELSEDVLAAVAMPVVEAALRWELLAPYALGGEWTTVCKSDLAEVTRTMTNLNTVLSVNLTAVAAVTLRRAGLTVDAAGFDVNDFVFRELLDNAEVAAAARVLRDRAPAVAREKIVHVQSQLVQFVDACARLDVPRGDSVAVIQQTIEAVDRAASLLGVPAVPGDVRGVLEAIAEVSDIVHCLNATGGKVATLDALDLAAEKVGRLFADPGRRAAFATFVGQDEAAVVKGEAALRDGCKTLSDQLRQELADKVEHAFRTLPCVTRAAELIGATVVPKTAGDEETFVAYMRSGADTAGRGAVSSQIVATVTDLKTALTSAETDAHRQAIDKHVHTLQAIMFTYALVANLRNKVLAKTPKNDVGKQQHEKIRSEVERLVSLYDATDPTHALATVAPAYLVHAARRAAGLAEPVAAAGPVAAVGPAAAAAGPAAAAAGPAAGPAAAAAGTETAAVTAEAAAGSVGGTAPPTPPAAPSGTEAKAAAGTKAKAAAGTKAKAAAGGAAPATKRARRWLPGGSVGS